MLAEVASVGKAAREALRIESNSTIVEGIPVQVSVKNGLKTIATNAEVGTAHAGITALSAVTWISLVIPESFSSAFATKTILSCLNRPVI